jgi:hypothetical protein
MRFSRCPLMLLASLACNVFLLIYAVPLSYRHVEIGFARGDIEVLIASAETALSRPESGTKADAARFISGYYLPDTKIRRETAASRIVEEVRTHLLWELERAAP